MIHWYSWAHGVSSDPEFKPEQSYTVTVDGIDQRMVIWAITGPHGCICKHRLKNGASYLEKDNTVAATRIYGNVQALKAGQNLC